MALRLYGDGNIEGSVNLPSGTQINGSTLNNGKILQVVSQNTGTTVANDSNTWQSTGLSATITPSNSSSKILVLVEQNGCAGISGASGTALEIRLMRDSTVLAQIEGAGGYTATSLTVVYGNTGTSYLDSPNTTNSVTYSTEFRNEYNGSGVRVQVDSSVSTITLMEIAA